MSQTSTRKKKETKKALSFSQMTALSLHLEKIQRAQMVLQSLGQERQQIMNTIATELGIKKDEFPQWKLSEDGTAFIKQAPAKKKKETDSGTKDKPESKETKDNN